MSSNGLETPAERSMSIMIVDDVLKNIQLLYSILANEKYEIHFVTSGENALKSLNKMQIDLILLDIMMPEMDGFEVCEKLKENPETRDIPVIFLTAKDSVEDKVRGFGLGAVDYITKPFQSQEVLARLRTHLALKKSQETIRQYNDQLETLLEKRTKALVRSERQAAFGQLVQGIVHNLKSPLSASSISAQMLRMGLRNVEKAKQDEGTDEIVSLNALVKKVQETLEIIEQSNEALDNMINSLLTKSRQDRSDKAELVDANEILRRELEFMRADPAFKYHVSKEVTLSEEPLLVEVVPGEFSQVIQNLIRNALDAMHGQPQQPLTLITERAGNNARLIVKDGGPGIPENIIDKIFDPFFTTKATRDSAEKGKEKEDGPHGTGLGLWMCRETVESFHGSIVVASEPGRGATFTVEIPLKRRRKD